MLRQCQILTASRHENSKCIEGRSKAKKKDKDKLRHQMVTEEETARTASTLSRVRARQRSSSRSARQQGTEKHRTGSLEKVHARSRVLGHIAHSLSRQGLQLLAVHQVHILSVCVQLQETTELLLLPIQ